MENNQKDVVFAEKYMGNNQQIETETEFLIKAGNINQTNVEVIALSSPKAVSLSKKRSRTENVSFVDNGNQCQMGVGPPAKRFRSSTYVKPNFVESGHYLENWRGISRNHPGMPQKVVPIRSQPILRRSPIYPMSERQPQLRSNNVDSSIVPFFILLFILFCLRFDLFQLFQKPEPVFEGYIMNNFKTFERNWFKGKNGELYVYNEKVTITDKYIIGTDGQIYLVYKKKFYKPKCVYNFLEILALKRYYS